MIYVRTFYLLRIRAIFEQRDRVFRNNVPEGLVMSNRRARPTRKMAVVLKV